MDFLNALIAILNFVVIPATAYGAQLALGALGVTLIYAILRFSNFAHGDTMAFGTAITILITWAINAAGIALTPLSARGAATSFWAAILCLPLFLMLRLLLGEAPLTPRLVAAELVGFAAGWAGYALATLPLAASLNRDMLWPRFLAAWNWVSLVQYGMIVLLSLVVGLLPGWLGQGVQLAGLGYALWLQWFATGLALRQLGNSGVWLALLASYVLRAGCLALFLPALLATLRPQSATTP